MRECEKTTPQANVKAQEVKEFGDQFFGKGKYTTWEKNEADLKAVAEKFGGRYVDTGGHCMVTVIPFDKYHCIGINEDIITVYRTNTPHEDYLHIFFDDDENGEEDEKKELYCHLYEEELI